MSTTEIIQELNCIKAAEAAVRPFVGAMDTSGAVSANGVYIAALHALGHNTKGLAGHANAARAMFDAVKHGGVQRRMATDGAANTAMHAKFPGVAKLKIR